MSQKRPALKQGTLNFLSKPSARKNPREICNAGSESADNESEVTCSSSLVEPSSESEKPKSSSGGSYSMASSHKATADLIRTLFKNKNDKIIHNASICKDKCSSLSTTEKERIKNWDDKFNHDWIHKQFSYCEKTGYWWVVYVEGEGVYCLLCKKHKCINTKNKSDVFSFSPSVRTKKNALADHASTGKHRGAIETELVTRISVFEKEVVKKNQVQDQVLEKTFHAMYWLAHEGIANEKITSLLNLVKKLGVEELKYFEYTARASLREIFVTLGQTLEDDIAKKARVANCFSLMLDDSTDVSTKEQMIAYIQFWDSDIADINTSFLFIENVLENASNANAEALYNLVKNKLEQMGLDYAKLSGLSTDGASVMVGRRDGLVAKIKRDNPSLLAIHCICHRLALACTDTNADLHYLKDVESYVTQMWKVFHYSAVKLTALLNAQTEIHQMNLSEHSKRLVTKTMKKACQTRWLSFENSVQSLHQEFVAVVQTLNKFSNDATCFGLMKKVTSTKFVCVLYILQKVLPILADLSRHFQKGNVNFSMVCPAIDGSKYKLTSLTAKEISSAIVEDFSSTGRCMPLSLTSFKTDDVKPVVETFLGKYVTALTKNIDARFEQTPLLSAFCIFDVSNLPARESVQFSCYGISEIGTLSGHFFPGKEDEKTELLAEWGNFKFHLLSWKKEWSGLSSEDSSLSNPLDWVIRKLLCLGKTVAASFFPHLTQLAEKILTLPVSNAWPERGFSKLKLTKTNLRNRLQNDVLQSLLQVSLNGPKPCSEGADLLIQNSVEVWKGAKVRRKLPKPPQPAPIQTLADNDQLIDLVQQEYDKAVRVLRLAKFAQKVADIESYESDESLSEFD